MEFEAVVRTHHARVLRLCCALLGDRTAGEEAAQDTFLRAWRGWSGFRGEGDLVSWLYAIARNCCRTARAQQRPSDSLDDADVLQRVEARAARGGPPARATAVDAAAALAELPEEQRQALTLFYLGEQSYAEIAAALDAPLGSVKTWIHRGRQRLAARSAAWR